MYGESGYHGAYAAGQSELGNGMHKSPSGSECVFRMAPMAVSLHVSLIWSSYQAAFEKITVLSRPLSCSLC